MTSSPFYIPFIKTDGQTDKLMVVLWFLGFIPWPFFVAMVLPLLLLLFLNKIPVVVVIIFYLLELLSKYVHTSCYSPPPKGCHIVTIRKDVFYRKENIPAIAVLISSFELLSDSVKKYETFVVRSNLPNFSAVGYLVREIGKLLE